MIGPDSSEDVAVGGTQALAKDHKEGGVLVKLGDVEQLLHPCKSIKERRDLRITQGELVPLHLDPGTTLLHSVPEESLHCLA